MKKIFSLTLLTLLVSYASFALTPIVGPTSGCMGTNYYFSDTLSPGGTWSSSNTAVGTIGSLSGILTPISVGVTTISYTVGLSVVTLSFTVNPSPAAIVGPTTVCVGSTVTLSDATSGGVWTSSNPSFATIGSATGVVAGVAAGSVNMYYTVGTCYVYNLMTVTAAPSVSSITGPTTVCLGSTITLADATPGGTWTSSAPAVATVGSSTGIVSGLSIGSTVITYSKTNSCGTATATYTVNVATSSSVATITGPSTVCLGSTITLADATSGGVWSSSSTLIASVGSSSGVVTGNAVGTAIITYSVSSCGSSFATHTVTVLSSSTVGAITGTTTTTVGSSSALFDAVSGGTWSSSNTAIATVGSTTGIVYGVAAGTCTITYSLTGCSGTTDTTTTFTVTAVDRISGHITFPLMTDSTDTIKVWLITYDTATHMLAAVDSYYTSLYSTSVYYQFLGHATDSYRVKAAVLVTPFVSTGFIPTYHISHYYWHDADVIYHVAGTADDFNDINMAYGSVTPGPGFIAGDVTTGANRRTSGSGAPAVGLYVYLLNSSGAVVQQAITDAAGHYSFSNLPLGTYTVFPEALNYLTTAYTGITLTSTSSSMSAASFIQHTISRTITPHTTAVPNVQATVSNVATFPNPTTGRLNIQWYETTTENASVLIADIAGHVVYTGTLKMAQGAGAAEVDLSTLTNGLYTITVKSANIDYNNKLQVQH